MSLDRGIPSETDPATGLPIGPLVRDPGPARRPERVVLDGQWCRLEPLDPARHAADLWRSTTAPGAEQRHRYLFEAVPTSEADYRAWLERMAASTDPLVFAVIDKRSGRAEGRQTLMRITPEHRSIEIGSIHWGPAIARSQVTTEANFLFARYAFETLGYRRYEWKCDALNAPSRAAALRFGFQFEGIFRRHMIIKGRTRDTAWFAMTEDDWPSIKAATLAWLSPSNFDADGRQRLRLQDLLVVQQG
ncbi:MAG: GNAT family N-acetyltransferase [Hyphomicrobiales bacterium]|nr:GNAT family N-acetyltransferase [Hyphomicrobiales bacterium]